MGFWIEHKHNTMKVVLCMGPGNHQKLSEKFDIKTVWEGDFFY